MEGSQQELTIPYVWLYDAMMEPIEKFSAPPPGEEGGKREAEPGIKYLPWICIHLLFMHP